MNTHEYDFAVDSFVIHDTWSLHKNTDHISASIAVTRKPKLKHPGTDSPHGCGGNSNHDVS